MVLMSMDKRDDNSINTKTLIKALMTTSFPFPRDEVWNLMNEELSKDPAEMDAELIDICNGSFLNSVKVVEKRKVDHSQ